MRVLLNNKVSVFYPFHVVQKISSSFAYASLPTEKVEPTTQEALETMSTESRPDVVAQIKGQLLEMPELGDDSVAFRSVPLPTSRRLTSLRQWTAET